MIDALAPSASASRSSAAVNASRAGAVACGLLSLFMALVYMAARAGFGFSSNGVMGVLGLAWCLTNLAPVLHRLVVRNESSDWWHSEGFIILVTIVLTAATGYWALEFGFELSLLLFLVGLAAFLWNAAAAVRSSRGIAILGFFVAVLLYSFWLAGVEWANGFLSPLFVENLILHGGEGHYDTLFLTSLGNMINTYGVPSTGWDGVPYTAYHFGSSWLFAQWANLTGLSVLDFYLIGVPVAVVPLFLRGLLVMGAEVRGLVRSRGAEVPAARFAPMALLVACATIGFLPPTVLNSAGVWEIGPFLSESHVLGTAVSLLLLSVIASFARNSISRRGDATRSQLSAIPIVLILIPVGLGAIGVIKVAHLLVFGAVMIFLLWRLRLYRQPVYLLGAAVLGIIALVVYRYVVWSGLNEGVAPLNFLRELIPLTWWPAFLILHLFWTWLYALLRLRQESAETFSDVRSLIAARQIVDVETVLLLGVLGVLPGMLFTLRSDAYYFSDLQRWFSLSLLLGNTFLITSVWSDKKWNLSGVFTRGRLRSLRIDQFVTAVLAACVVTTMIMTVLTWGGRLIRTNMNTRREIQEIVGNRPVNSLKNEILGFVRHPIRLINGGIGRVVSVQLGPLADNEAFVRALRVPRREAVVHTMLEIGRLPVKERRKSLIYVEETLDDYWNFFGTKGACSFSAMIGPTLSATAMLDGVPPDCPLRGFYGEEAYKPKPAPAENSAVSVAELCSKAKARGFGRVIAILPTSDGKLSSSRISCNARESASAPPG